LPPLLLSTEMRALLSPWKRARIVSPVHHPHPLCWRSPASGSPWGHSLVPLLSLHPRSIGTTTTTTSVKTTTAMLPRGLGALSGGGHTARLSDMSKQKQKNKASRKKEKAVAAEEEAAEEVQLLLQKEEEEGAAAAAQKEGGGSPKHTVLVDGSFMNNRAHHAPVLFHMTNRAGESINAIHSYTRSMLTLLKDLGQIDHIGVFADWGPSFRKELYSQYKANRPPASEELKKVFPVVAKATKALGIETIKVKGIEADDLIACYTKIARAQGHRVTIVTRDKDLMQLISPMVQIYDPVNKKTIDENSVRSKFLVEPKQVRDVLALMGDDGDNIPGVVGIGPKTAAALVNQFNSVEELLENVSKIVDSKKRKLIEDNVEIIRTSLALVELHYDVDLPLSLEDLQKRPIQREPFLAFLQAHSLDSIISRLDQICPPANTAQQSTVPSSPKPSLKKEKSQPSSPAEETLHQEKKPLSVAAATPSKRPKLEVEGVTIVDTPEEARRVLSILRSPGVRERYHACDTEVISIDIKKQSPYNYGEVICASIYCGSDVDFGNGPNIWIDNMDDAKGVLNLFQEYFEDEEIKKVWHNYSFDRAIMWRHGIDVKGFGGDTIHMARLWDAARTSVGKKYSLEALTAELLEGKHKRSIKEIFGKYKLKKDGSPSKGLVVPPLDSIQRGEVGMDALVDWIFYSTFDTRGTYELRDKLEEQLRGMPWVYEGKRSLPGANQTIWDYYQNYWLPFGEVLTHMEREGIKIDVGHLAKMEELALGQCEQFQSSFKEWASEYCQDACYMNPNSDAQKQQLFFAPCKNGKSDELMPAERLFDIENTEEIPDPVTGKVKKKRQITISGFGLPPIEYTASGWPAVGAEVLKQLAGKPNDNPPKYGQAYKPFGEGETGAEACKAIDSLVRMSSIDTLIHNFIVPLQHEVDQNNRIHASLNINTETGRLSCRRPNLQNQPALEKDIYKIRSAFTCEKGKKLIVADYGQLELRLLAHMTKCRSMIDAFEKGGDFHSRTALGMYAHVQEAIKKGDVLLEWGEEGKPPVPLLKDMYATERKRAKTLNFSIAYGKTAVGLSRDWGVSLNEAKDTLRRWYEDRPEVLAWQQNTIQMARNTGYTKTLMGRYRPLADINSSRPMLRGHAERAAINTPIQGGAADIVINAMLLTHHDEVLRRWGWKMILQVHDELMLEGPQESAEEALERLVHIMRNPMPEGEQLLVELSVDGKVGSTWYEAK